MDRAALGACCKNNAQAMEWLSWWREYVHLIDDIIDEDLAECGTRSAERGVKRGTERVNRMGILALQLYTHPFFRQHEASLKQLIVNITVAYELSVEWETSEMDWRRVWSDHYRHAGVEMVIAVAGICGGYEHARSIAPIAHSVCYQEHHDSHGRPV